MGSGHRPGLADRLVRGSGGWKRPSLRRAATLLTVATACGVVGALVPAVSASASPRVADRSLSRKAPLPTALHVNFQPSGAVPNGYTADTGVAYNGTSGWTDTSGNALDMTGNTRIRHSSLSPDARYDTLIQMQEVSGSTPGTQTPGRWTSALANGFYSVTVAVGDSAATNSVDEITAQPGTPQAKVIINKFVPSSTNNAYWSTQTAIVDVENGALTLDPTGGSNTKLDFVDAVPAPADTTPPTVTVTPSGTQGSSSTDFVQSATVTINATDDRGVTSTTYSLDNGATQSYTAPFTVTGIGSHTVTATALDAANNQGTATSTFTISAPVVATSAHIDFQANSGKPQSGYVANYGLPYSSAAGLGWLNQSTGAPLDMTGNGRNRNSSASPDRRSDTLLQMQETASSSPGTQTPGKFELDLQNGYYTVTVGVGDAIATNSVYEIEAQTGTANAVQIINKATPTSSNLFFVATKTVNVTTGSLILDAVGGSNTKIDYLDVVPAGPDTTPPTVTIAEGGVQGSSSTDYVQSATVTINATDDRGVASTTYTVDSGATQTYSGPFTVTGLGSHTVTATATDTASPPNATTVSSTFTVSNPPSPTSAHIDFQANASNPASGYVANYGLPYSSAAGLGWENQNTGAPLDMTGNGRNRNSGNSPDKRYDTLIAMQLASAQYGGTTTPGKFELDLQNGTYSVTAAVGDAAAYNSVYELEAQTGTPDAVQLFNQVVPSASNLFFTTTQVVTVSNGALVLDAIGGSNTKIDFLDVVPYTKPDTTPPTASISLSGTAGTDPNTYTGDVSVTVNAADEKGGSGLASVTYTIDGGSAHPYSGPFTVTSDGSHTVTATATDNARNSYTVSSSWTQAEPARLSISSAADPLIHEVRSRMVFSSVYAQTTAPNQQLTFTNVGGQTLTVSGFSLGGTNASDFTLPNGAGSLSIPPGQSATVTVGFAPAAPTNCPTSSNPDAVGTMARSATLSFTTNDPNSAVNEALAGIVSCNFEGNYEPTLDQIFSTLGYSTVVVSPSASDASRRYLGALRYIGGTDEIDSPYFTAANPAVPVKIVPLAHYSGRNTNPSQNTGWYGLGTSVTTPCNSACNNLWNFPADTSSGYTQNQTLLPTPSGTETFSPTGAFGIYSGDGGDVNFSDDSLNTAHDTSGKVISPAHYLHSLRIYPAYGPGHTLIPNSYLVGIDITRVPSYKNNDDQDVVLLVTNAAPYTPTAPSAGAAALNDDFTAGGTVSSTCAVTGFTGVLANNNGSQCSPGNISFGTNGLTLTSSAGQLATGDQQNALYENVNAGQGQFVIRARIVGGINQLTSNYQQIATWFGPDTNNFIKAEIEHNGSGNDPHISMFYDENGTANTIASVSVPSATTASTVDLIITGNTQVPDPIAASSDTNGVRNYPLDELTVSYSINGAAPVQVGTTYESPANLATWFSSNAQAGILVSNSGSSTPIQATFSSLSIKTS